jgi:hypothetical protein
MAINLYLTQKYEGPMHCVDAKVLGLAAQWSFWAMLEMEGLLLDLLQHRALLPEFARDASYAERDELLLRKPLEVLNNALRGRDHLTDSRSSTAGGSGPFWTAASASSNCCGVAIPTRMVPIAGCETANRVAASVRLAANPSFTSGISRWARSTSPA